ncbi:type VI secretion system Vgr family protein [Sorangium sp. So ce1667]
MALDVILDFVDRFIEGLAVRRYVLRGALNDLFELVILVNSTDPEIAVDNFLGHPVRIHFNDEPFVREIRGIVRRLRQLSAAPWGVSLYELTVVPPLWLATRRRDHRIFQHQTVPEIARTVLDGYTGRIPGLHIALTEPKAAREYCVQYGETDCDFIFRILSEDGIAAYFDANDGGAFHIIDDTTVTRSTAPLVPYRPPSGDGIFTTEPHVLSVEISSDVETSSVRVRDFDFEKPSYSLDQSEKTEGPMFTNEDDLEAYEYAVGRFNNDGDGKALARQILEESRALRRVLRCETDFMLLPGSHFVISDHPRSDVNGEFLVVRIDCLQESHDGRPAARRSLLCVPAKTPYRPPRRPKPRIHGTQTALVVGDAGQEVHVDVHGRVKLAFRWDRRDFRVGSPTRYVRVSQAWAGAGIGFVALPRVNDEVVVAYLDGDPDEPLVVGRVYNVLQAMPLNLPNDKTKTVWRSSSSPGGGGYNEIMMDDKAGAEKFEIHAHRDFQQSTGRDASVSVGNDAKRSVTAHDTTTIGGNQTVSVTGSQSFASASYSNSSGTISMSARREAAIHAGVSITSDAPVISEKATSKITQEAPLLSHNGTVITVSHGGVMLALSAGTYAGLASGGLTVVSGPTISISGGTNVEVTAPNVTVGGGSKVSVEASEVKVTGGKVEIGGGSEVTVGGGKVGIAGDGELSLGGGVIKIG